MSSAVDTLLTICHNVHQDPITTSQNTMQRNEDLEDTLAAMEADNGVTIPHKPAVAIMNGASPIQAFRDYRGLTLQELSNRTNLSSSYLSEIERGRKAGSISALTRIAKALGTTIDTLVDV